MKTTTDKKAAEKVEQKLRAAGYDAEIQEANGMIYIGFGLCLSKAKLKRGKPDALALFRFANGRIVFTVRGPSGTEIAPSKWDSAAVLCDLANSKLTVPFIRLSRPDGHVEAARDLPYELIDNDEEFDIFWKGAITMWLHYGQPVVKALSIDLDKMAKALSKALHEDDEDDDDDDDDDMGFCSRTGSDPRAGLGAFLKSMSACTGESDDSWHSTDDKDDDYKKQEKPAKRRPGRPRGSRSKR